MSRRDLLAAVRASSILRCLPMEVDIILLRAASGVQATPHVHLNRPTSNLLTATYSETPLHQESLHISRAEQTFHSNPRSG